MEGQGRNWVLKAKEEPLAVEKSVLLQRNLP